MILISSEGDRFEVEDEYATYSPFLEGVLDTTESKEAKLDRLSTKALKAYISFLEGQVPKMDTEIEEAFDFMGHPNVLQYPLDYWPIKLHDVWVRDNMYRLSLLDDPFYDLVEIPILAENYIKPLPKGIYAAGGYALYLSGHTKQIKDKDGYSRQFSDIDLFTADKQVMEQFLLSLEHEVQIEAHTVNISMHDLWLKNIRLIHRSCYKGQIILRLYKAPTEIVHGFDLDCCGFLLSHDDGTPRLWATKRALWSIQNKANWFDPDRMSPSYAYRMAKYMTRGFKPMLPMFPEIQGNALTLFKNRVHEMYDGIKCRFQKAIMNDTYEFSGDDYLNPIPQYERILPLAIKFLKKRGGIPRLDDIAERILTIDKYIGLDIEHPWGQMGVLMRIEHYARKDTEGLVPQDPASIVILAALEGFYTSSWTGYDYIDPDCPGDTKVSMNLIQELEWRTVDPMSQLSGTFHPDPIKDLRAWYLTSPLLKDILPPNRNGTFARALLDDDIALPWAGTCS